VLRPQQCDLARPQTGTAQQADHTRLPQIVMLNGAVQKIGEFTRAEVARQLLPASHDGMGEILGRVPRQILHNRQIRPEGAQCPHNQFEVGFAARGMQIQKPAQKVGSNLLDGV